MRTFSKRAILIGVACTVAGAVTLPPTVAVGAEVLQTYVQVSNPPSNPVNTREVREPYTQVYELRIPVNMTGSSNGTLAVKVPDGKRLVIESVAAQSQTHQGDFKVVTVVVSTNPVNIDTMHGVFLTGTWTGRSGVHNRWVANQQVLLHANSGEYLNFGAQRECVLTCVATTMRVVVSGWLEPAPVPQAP